MDCAEKDRFIRLLREDLRLSLTQNTPAQRARKIQVQEEIQRLAHAGLDEAPAFRTGRINPHDN